MLYLVNDYSHYIFNLFQPNLTILQHVSVLCFRVLPHNSHTYRPHFFYSFINQWTLGLFPVFAYTKQYCCWQLFCQTYDFILLSSCLGIKSLGELERFLFNLLGYPHSFPKKYVSSYIPTTNIWCQFLHIFAKYFL